MKVATEALEGREVRLVVQLDQEELDRAMQEAARRIAREVQIPGFRRGKAPYAVVVRMVGREAVREEALDSLLPQLYEQALEEAQVEPFAQGVLEEVSESDPPVLRFRVPLEPLVELGDYRSLRVEWQEPEVPEEEVQKVLEGIAEKHASWEPKDGPIAEGDLVKVDILGRTEDGEPAFDGKGQSLVVRLDSLYPVPGFHKELLGLRAGETKEFTLPFPENTSSKRLAGKAIRFQVAVHEVRGLDVPPLDDDLAKLEGDYETLEDLRKAIRERLLQERRAEAEGEYEAKVLKALRDLSRVEFPAAALERELENLLERQEEALQERGLNLKTYLSILKVTPEAYREGLKPQAQERLMNRHLLVKLAEEEGLEPTEEEKAALVNEWFGPEEQRPADEKLKELLESEEFQEMVRNTLRQGKALRWLIRHARGEVQGEGPAADEGEPLPEAIQADEGPTGDV